MNSINQSIKSAITGTYNWDFVFGLEQIVEWCRAHGVKVMFTVLDNWSPVDSKTAVRHALTHPHDMIEQLNSFSIYLCYITSSGLNLLGGQTNIHELGSCGGFGMNSHFFATETSDSPSIRLHFLYTVKTNPDQMYILQ